MNLQEFSKHVMEKAMDRFEYGDISGTKAFHGAIGLSGEAGELLDLFKKSVYKKTPIDPLRLVDEAGDVLFYLTLVLEASGSSIQEAMDVNYAKLTARYGDKYSLEGARLRDKVAETKAMEKVVGEQITLFQEG